MNVEEIVHEEHMRRLEELTLGLSGGPDNGHPGCVQYDVEGGISFGFMCLDDPKISVQKAVMSKGSRFPEHIHDENEWLIVYDGKVEAHVDGIEILLDRSSACKHSIIIPAGTPHYVDALEDSWILGVSIPPASGYPK